MLRYIYLALAIAGAVVPYFFFIQFISAEGLDLASFTANLFANPPAAGFTADLLITSVVFWIFMFIQNKRKGAPAPWLFIVLNLAIGLSCALPAYLYLREVRAG